MKKYIISTVVPGAALNHKFLKTITAFCQQEKAEALFLLSKPLYVEDEVDPDIIGYGQVIEKDLQLNNKISLSTIMISPDQVDPIQGLDRLGHYESSIVYASPKQRLKSVASPSDTFPRCIMTTGACTLPFYKSSKLGQIATLDHVNGALIVEIESNKDYHYRQVQAEEDGSFIDLGLRYTSNKKKEKAKVAALIPGDWHAGYTDPLVSRATDEMISMFNPKNLILHDFFDGVSVNHHMEAKLLSRAMLGEKGDLSKELDMAAAELGRLSKKKTNIVLVKSNHDEFLDRWINEGKYLTDTRNHIIGLKLALLKAIGKDPLQAALMPAKAKNIKFLKSDESFMVSKKYIECGAHGHLGANGAKGTPKSMERSYINSVTGHSHSPEIQRGAWVVGTSTHLKLSYNRGPSSWLQTHCIVYENGSRQLINILNGKWRG